jgi:hypothetical protein
MDGEQRSPGVLHGGHEWPSVSSMESNGEGEKTDAVTPLTHGRRGVAVHGASVRLTAGTRLGRRGSRGAARLSRVAGRLSARRAVLGGPASVGPGRGRPGSRLRGWPREVGWGSAGWRLGVRSWRADAEAGLPGRCARLLADEQGRERELEPGGRERDGWEREGGGWERELGAAARVGAVGCQF